MAEYIERDALLADISAAVKHRGMGEIIGQTLMRYVKRQPAADVVPVVRCKDCKYCIKEDDYEFWCNGFCSPVRLVNPEDFCSHGFNKSELCCCLNGTSEEAEAAIERVKARIGRVNNG